MNIKEQANRAGFNEACEIIGCDRDSLRAALDNKTIPSVVSGSRRVMSLEDVEIWWEMRLAGHTGRMRGDDYWKAIASMRPASEIARELGIGVGAVYAARWRGRRDGRIT